MSVKLLYTVEEVASAITKTVRAIKFKDFYTSLDEVKDFVGEKYVHVDSNMSMSGRIDRSIVISGDVMVDGKTTRIHENEYLVKITGYYAPSKNRETYRIMIVPEIQYYILFKKVAEHPVMVPDEGEDNGK